MLLLLLWDCALVNLAVDCVRVFVSIQRVLAASATADEDVLERAGGVDQQQDGAAVVGLGGGDGGWSRKLLKYGLVIVAYSIVVCTIFRQLLEENQLDVIIRKKVPDVL